MLRRSGSNSMSRFDRDNIRVGASGLRGCRVNGILLNVFVYGSTFSSALCLELLRGKMSGIEVRDVANSHTLWTWGGLGAAEEERTLNYLPILEFPVTLDDATVQEGNEDFGLKVSRQTRATEWPEDLHVATTRATTTPTTMETHTAWMSVRSIFAEPPFQQMRSDSRKEVTKK